MATDTITALGAGSGIDIKALAKSLTDAVGTPAKDIINKRITKSTSNISGYSALKFVVNNLKTAFADLKNQSSFNSITTSNSQPTALSLVTGATATTGSHSVSVSALAAPQRNISAGFATAATALNGGAAFALSLAVHGAPAKSIAVSVATPAGVVAAINSAALGVTAQLINTGDAATPFKILVKGNTGTANDFSLRTDNGTSGITATTTQGATGTTESSSLAFGRALTAGESITVGGLTYTSTGSTSTDQLAAAFAGLANGATTGPGTGLGAYTGALSGFSTGAATGSTIVATSTTTGNVSDIQTLGAGVTGLDFGTQLQAAANASLTVNGVAITNSSNSIEGAITGVTLNLNTVTTSPVVLNFSRDTSSVKTKLQAVVTSYNEAITMTNVVSDSKSTVENYGATLVGNTTVTQIRNQMRELILGDSSSPAGGLSALRDLGMSVNRDGVLQLDAVKLDAALSTKFDSVVTMLSANRENQSTFSTLSAGVAGDAVKKLTALLDTTGLISTQSSNANAKIAASKKELAKLETRLATMLAGYSKQLAAMDSIVGESKSMRTGLTATFDGMMASYTRK
jgi:flagellar hook-associated protein 2